MVGFRVDCQGLQPIPTKLVAITEAPEPKNVQELRAFLGLVNYYGQFMSQLSTITHPMNRLLCKGMPWVWGQECASGAFTLLKSKLASAEVLAHYDPSSWIVIPQLVGLGLSCPISIGILNALYIFPVL